MKSSQACLELSADYNLCISESCFFVQLESGMWICVNKLAGLQDVMRVIPPHFPEYCEREEQYQQKEQNENDTLAEINETGTNIRNNPFLAIECSPIVHPTSQHIQLEMEELPPIVLPPSPNTSPESSPEVMPTVGTVTRSGRAINPPDFFRA
ncbi:unnamed protein product [Orchesella dallaii]|uniref:Uncharacterized protein n=1 Tax=Orchesella dallaii TaxID=48710 RepID=A0ABP1R7Y0_9HEXA